jgi:hypothetical protein
MYMPIVTLSMPQKLINQFEAFRTEKGLSDGTFLIKKSPLVCKLIEIGLHHKDEFKLDSELK